MKIEYKVEQRGVFWDVQCWVNGVFEEVAYSDYEDEAVNIAHLLNREMARRNDENQRGIPRCLFSSRAENYLRQLLEKELDNCNKVISITSIIVTKLEPFDDLWVAKYNGALHTLHCLKEILAVLGKDEGENV